MEVQHDHSCPICAYEFSTPDRLPKLLPCSHTLCRPCIDEIIAQNSDSSFKCPICRKDANIPKDGVKGFLDNYFITAPPHDESCDICGTKDSQKLKICKQCKSVLCNSCNESHHHQVKIKQSSIDYDDDHRDSDEEKNKHDDDSHEDFSSSKLGNSYRKFVKSAYFGLHDTSFKCNNFESIRKIIPDDNNECWVLTNRPFVTKFSRSGKERYRKYVDSVLQDIDRCNDGTLALAFSDGEILLLKGQELRRSGTNVENVPTAIYAYKDGRLLISTKQRLPGNTHLNNSELLITDQTMKKFDHLDVNVELQEVSSITVNEKNGLIALCETLKKCVFLLEQSSKTFKVLSLKKYEGKKCLKRHERRKDDVSFGEDSFFQPQSVVSDQIDNFYVLDTGTNNIHVLDGEASLQAIVLLNITGIVNIGCFNMDHSGNLWIGDTSGEIRVYRMETIRNDLQQENQSDGRSYLPVSDEFLEDSYGMGTHRLRVSDIRSIESDLTEGFVGSLTSPDQSSEENSLDSNSFFRNFQQH